MRKSDIETMALSSLPLRASDILRKSRTIRGMLTMRHVWPDDVDARIWHGIRAVAYGALQDLANSINAPAELYAADGYVMHQCTPEDK